MVELYLRELIQFPSPNLELSEMASNSILKLFKRPLLIFEAFPLVEDHNLILLEEFGSLGVSTLQVISLSI